MTSNFNTGLSGEEDFLAKKEIVKELEKKLYDTDMQIYTDGSTPQLEGKYHDICLKLVSVTGDSKYVDMYLKVRCPNCGSKNTQELFQANGPDDYDVTGLECLSCGFREDY